MIDKGNIQSHLGSAIGRAGGTMGDERNLTEKAARPNCFDNFLLALHGCTVKTMLTELTNIKHFCMGYS